MLAGRGGDDSDGARGAATPGEIMPVAASLTAAFTEIGQQYTAANGGTRVLLNLAGSQALATQIQQAAPADVFASADLANMDKVNDLVGTPQTFASNQLQIVVEKGNPKNVATVETYYGDLKVVLAAPDVPAGRYAAEILGKAGVTVKPVSKEDNVKAVVTKVSSARPTPGSSTSPTSPPAGTRSRGSIPEELNVLATYLIATVKASKAQDQAQEFMDLVLSAEGQQVLKEFVSAAADDVTATARRPRRRAAPATAPARNRVPAWFAVPAALAVGFLAVPLLGLLGRVLWGASAPS